MRIQSKRVDLYDGTVVEVLKGQNSTQVEITNSYYDKNRKNEENKGNVSASVTMKLDNPAQAEGLNAGDKVAIFKDGMGRVNLVRDGQWKASESVMVTSKKDPSKQYDNGITVILGKCTGMRLIKPKEGQNFNPFLAMSIMTSDHVHHNITINNREPYETDAIERTMDRFKDYMENEEHGFIPFTGTFITGMCYRSAENPRTVGDVTYQNVERSYSGLVRLGSFNDYTKAGEPYAKSQPQQEAQAQATQESNPNLDTNAELGEELGDFVGIPEGYEEELPFE